MRSAWRPASVVEVIRETRRAVTVVLDLADWPGHRPGQYVDVRPATCDESQHRSHWIASGRSDGYLAVTMAADEQQRPVPAPDDVTAGSILQVRGPGGAGLPALEAGPDPLLLIAGGLGLAPLRALLRDWVAVDHQRPLRLLYSARSPADILYRDELLRLAAYEELDVRIALTREWPDDWHGHVGRIGDDVLRRAVFSEPGGSYTIVAGALQFTNACAHVLLEIGCRREQIVALPCRRSGH